MKCLYSRSGTDEEFTEKEQLLCEVFQLKDLAEQEKNDRKKTRYING